MSDANIIYIDELNEIMDNDTELIKECFDEFCKDWSEAFGLKSHLKNKLKSIVLKVFYTL